MKNQKDFLAELEQLAQEQAIVEASSPLPEWSRELAAMMGKYPWQTLLIASLSLSIVIAAWFFPLIYKLYQKGIIQWLLS